MQVNRRAFLAKIGMGGMGMAGGALLADEFTNAGVASHTSIGDPFRRAYALSDMAHFPEDVPSATLANGKVLQPAREIPIFGETDVLVVGGGPAGFSAALASARAGAKTILVERYGSLGGLFTNGLVLVIIGTADGTRLGKQRLVTCGICREFMEHASKMGDGAYRCDLRHGPYQPTIDPESAKILMDRMVRAEKNLEVFFHCWNVDVIQCGSRVCGIIFESKEGRKAILAKRVIDATGDGDVAFQAGADYRQIRHNIGFVTQLGNIGKATPQEAQNPAAHGFPRLSNEPIKSAFWKNELGVPRNGLAVRDLTTAEFEHREKIWNLVEKMRSTPGFEETYVMTTCSQVGVRATRLIKTDYTLTREDALSHKVFTDTIGMSGDETFTQGAFQIPYRALLPQGVENVLVAGRAVGVSPDLIDRVRLIPVCMVTGEAAGAAAALSLKKDCSVHNLDAEALRTYLSQHGVCLA